MDIRIHKSVLRGELRAISSKSDAHRALICAALCDRSEQTAVYCNVISEDIRATLSVISALGAETAVDNEYILVRGLRGDRQREISGDVLFSSDAATAVLDCGESGSTLRFMIPVAAALGVSARFVGHGRLPDRPVDGFLEELTRHGTKADGKRLPFTVCGGLRGGHFSLPGNISSQFFTGILLALPLIGEEAFVEVCGRLESSAYVDMTIHTMSKFGVNIDKENNGFLYDPKKGGNAPSRGGSALGGNIFSSLQPVYETEGDWSNSAFFIVADALQRYKLGGNGYISLSGLEADSLQGDKRIVSIAGEAIAAAGKGYVLDASEVPDLVPAVAVLLSLTEGRHMIENAARLRIKESDRLSAVSNVLNEIGADIEELPDGLIINGRKSLRGGRRVSGFGDHRIVMALSVAGLFCEEPITIEGAEAVNKSYPDFFEKYRQLGGIADVI